MRSGCSPIRSILLTPGTCNMRWRSNLSMAGELARRHPLGLDRIKGEIGVRIFVIDEWPERALRQVSGCVSQLLARLVELIGHGPDRGRVFQRKGEKGETGPGEGFNPVVVFQLLEALLERLGDQVLHFLCSRAGPRGGYRQHFYREGGILGAAKVQKSERAGGHPR